MRDQTEEEKRYLEELEKTLVANDAKTAAAVKGLPDSMRPRNMRFGFAGTYSTIDYIMLDGTVERARFPKDTLADAVRAIFELEAFSDPIRHAATRTFLDSRLGRKYADYITDFMTKHGLPTLRAALAQGAKIPNVRRDGQPWDHEPARWFVKQELEATAQAAS